MPFFHSKSFEMVSIGTKSKSKKILHAEIFSVLFYVIQSVDSLI